MILMKPMCNRQSKTNRDVSQIEKSRKTFATSTGGADNNGQTGQCTRATFENLIKRYASASLQDTRLTGEGDVEGFNQQFQAVATATEWLNMATLLHIRMHLKDDARWCGSYSTLKEVLEALCSTVI